MIPGHVANKLLPECKDIIVSVFYGLTAHGSPVCKRGEPALTNGQCDPMQDVTKTGTSLSSMCVPHCSRTRETEALQGASEMSSLWTEHVKDRQMRWADEEEDASEQPTQRPRIAMLCAKPEGVRNRRLQPRYPPSFEGTERTVAKPTFSSRRPAFQAGMTGVWSCGL